MVLRVDLGRRWKRGKEGKVQLLTLVNKDLVYFLRSVLRVEDSWLVTLQGRDAGNPTRRRV
jgi:hypothetical protein